MPIPLIQPGVSKPNMNQPVYGQPGPRSSTGQLQTQMSNAMIPGIGKRTAAAAPTRRIQPFRGSTQPFTPPAGPVRPFNLGMEKPVFSTSTLTSNWNPAWGPDPTRSPYTPPGAGQPMLLTDWNKIPLDVQKALQAGDQPAWHPQYFPDLVKKNESVYSSSNGA